MDVGGLRRRDHRLGFAPARTARCSRPPCRRTARRPAADSRCAARARPAPIGRGPRRRGGPCRAPAPRRRRAARASDDLPEALGPITPSPSPALSEKLDVLHDEALPVPGGVALDALDRERALGAGSARGCPARRQCGEELARAVSSSGAPRRSRFQLAIASSTGASARAVRIELAMMILPSPVVDHEIGADPEHAGLQCHAQHLGDAPSPPATSEARCCASMNSALACAPERADTPTMPMACSTSALRRLASSASALRVPRSPDAVLSGSRVHHSVSERDGDKDQSAPTARSTPIQRWKRKQMREVERHPGQIEQRRRPERPTGTRGPGRGRGSAAGRRRRCASCSGSRTRTSIDARAQPLVERGADARRARARAARRAGPGRRTARTRSRQPTSVGTLRLGSTRS